MTAGVAVSPSIAVDVEDPFGNIVTTDSSNVALSVASGPGSPCGTFTVAASSGVATFNNVILNTTGNYTLMASDGSLTSATSGSFAVNSAAASQVVYGLQPSGVTAGIADSPSIAVDLEDQFGNIVTADGSNVTLAVASGPGRVSGTVTVAASSGVATYSILKFDTAGNYTLVASDGSTERRDLEQLRGIRRRGFAAGLRGSAEQRHGRSRREPVDRSRPGGCVRQHLRHRQFQRDLGGRQWPWKSQWHVDRSGR